MTALYLYRCEQVKGVVPLPSTLAMAVASATDTKAGSSLQLNLGLKLPGGRGAPCVGCAEDAAAWPAAKLGVCMPDLLSMDSCALQLGLGGLLSRRQVV